MHPKDPAGPENSAPGDTESTESTENVEMTDELLEQLRQVAQSYPFVCDGWAVDYDHNITSIRTRGRRYFDLRANLRWVARTLIPALAPTWSRVLTRERSFASRVKMAAHWLVHTNPDAPDAVVGEKIVCYWAEDGQFVATFDPPTVTALVEAAVQGRAATTELAELRTRLAAVLDERHHEAICSDGLRRDVIDLEDVLPLTVAPQAPGNQRCVYEPTWTDEVGTIPVCAVHGNNSRHVEDPDPHRPCLTVDPYPTF